MRTSVALVAVMVLPILLQLPELPEYLEEDEPTFPSVGATNPLGWEWVNKDTDAGFTWVKEVEGQSNGSFYVAGVFLGGSLNLESTQGGIHAPKAILNNGGRDVFVGHYTYNSGNGFWSWLSVFGGSEDEHVEDMILDSTGDLIVVGSYNSSSISVTGNSGTLTLNNQGGRDGYAFKIDGSTGTFDWVNSIASNGFDNITGVTETSVGDLAFCGWTSSASVTVNGTMSNGTGTDNDMFVAWSSSSGVWDQLRRYGSTGKEEAHDCAADGNDRIMLVGEFSSTSLILDQTTIVHGGGTGSDSIVMRVARTGVEWVRKPIATANDRAWSVDVDSAGNVFVAGEHFYNNSGSHEITWGSIRITDGRNHHMAYVVKFSNVGAIGWAIRSNFCYSTSSYTSYYQQWNPTVNVVDNNIAFGINSKGDNRLCFSGSTYSGNFYGGYQQSGWFFGITSTGAIQSSNFRHSSNSHIFDVDAIDNPSGTDFAYGAWSSLSRLSGDYTTSATSSISEDTSNAPYSQMVIHGWSSSSSSPGPTSSTYYRADIGFTSSEWVVDQERINSTHSVILVQGESQGLRFGDLSAGGTNEENVWIATVNETGAWTDLGHFYFGEDREASDIPFGIGMTAAPNGTVWVVVYWRGFLHVPGVVSITSGWGVHVLSWVPGSGWASADRLNGYQYSYHVPFDIVTDGNGDLWVLGECYSTVTIAGNSFSGSSQHQVCVAQRSSSGWIGVARSYSQYNPRVDAIAGHPNGGAVLWVRGDYWNRPGGGTQSLSNSDAGGLVRLHGNNRTMWLWDWPSCQGGSACNNVESIDVRANGDIVIGGYFTNSISFSNCCSVNSGGGYDGYMALWNASNHGWAWSIALGGTSHDYLYDVRFIGNGSIASVGEKSGVVSVGLTTLSNAGTGYVAMASDQGTWSWAQQPIGDTRIRTVIPAGNGSIEVAGELLYDNNIRTFGLDSLRSSDGEDLFVSRMSADQDADGITNNRDNCISIYNPPQEDFENDGIGDICDDDDDGDGVLDIDDSCPMGATGWTSLTVSDYDSDGCADAVEDDDDDEDSILDVDDSCLYGALNWTSTVSNDHDQDGCQDSVEDADDDNDLIYDNLDSCPRGETGWVSSVDTDLDGDGCLDGVEDDDDDGDGIDDDQDTCPTGATGWASQPSNDNDGDGCLDSQEDDNDDEDDFPDVDDSCPNGTVDWRSGSITDYDGDGCYDADEDLDDDADGVPDTSDNCPRGVTGWRTNPTIDLDQDGCHDYNEDWDDDGDGVGDLDDICPRTDLGMSVNTEGCAVGEIPQGSGDGGSVTYVNNTYQNNTYQNDTYVNTTYQNDTYVNNTYQNETSQNDTYVNNTYSNSSTSIAYENETFQNMTYLNETTGNDDENVNPINSLEQVSDSGFSFPLLEIVFLILLGTLVLIQTLAFRRRPETPSTFIDPHDHTSIFNEDTIVQEESNQESSTDVEEEIIEESDAEIESPPLDSKGTVDESGFEWIEWPAGSGINHYRKAESQDTWEIWQS